MTKTSAMAASSPQDAPLNLTEWLLSLLLGAAGAAACLTLLGFGAREIWSPFGQNTGGISIGSNVFRGLLFSGMVGGLAATVAMRGLARPSLRLLPGAACALGWGVLGAAIHFQSSTRFLAFLPAGRRDIAPEVFWSNGISQPLCVAFGLVCAAIIGWLAEKRFFAPQRLAQSQLPMSKAARKRAAKESETVEAVAPTSPVEMPLLEAPRAFSRNLSYPFFVAVPAFALLSLLGLVFYAMPLPGANELPSAPFRAVLAALVSALSFGGGAWLARRFFGSATIRNGQENTVAYLVAAPIVIAFVCGMWFESRASAVIFEPAARVIWNSSPFEAASWGAFGSALGFWLAGRKEV